MHSPNLTQRNIERLAELFPTVVTEQRDDEGNSIQAVDFDLLRQELSGHVIEGPRERYQLEWPGKRAALLAANAPVAKTLRPDRDQSSNFDTTSNVFIEGDNLEALKLLNESYLGRVKMIYIDPPYNTGRDFIYRDRFGETREGYLRATGQVGEDDVPLVSNPQSNGRFHSDWLTMMYPRLKLARNLLREDGVIFISIDDNELANLTKLCEEVFGSENHLATLVWKSKSGGANDSGGVAVDHEYIVCFARSAGSSPLGVDPDGVPTTSYPHEDEHGRYSLERLDKQNLQYSASLDYELEGADGSIYRLAHKNPAQPNAVWRWSKDRVARERDKLVFKDGNVYTKNYQTPGAKPRSLLVDNRFGRTRTGSTELRELLGGSYFDNPKPTKLIESLLAISTTDDSLVVDFFAGSATMAHAVMKVNARLGGNRRWILVQLPESVEEGSEAHEAGYSDLASVARTRIRRAAEEVRADHNSPSPDLGFRALRIDTSNFSQIHLTPDEVQQQSLQDLDENLKPERSQEDLLFEILLEWGLDIGAGIEVAELDGQSISCVDGGALIACFDEALEIKAVRSIAEMKPLRAVFRDSGFASDADRINAEQIFAEISPATDVKVI